MFHRTLARSVARRRCYSTDVKPYYVTTPIFYPNARPHVGHLHSLVVADVIARYQRILNPARPVVFLTGTDEHGLKMQQAAAAQGVDPQTWCDTLSSEFRALAARAHISGTTFMRTTHPHHRATVAHVWRVLADRGLIYKDTYEGYYATADECFYPRTRVMRHPTRPDTHIAVETGAVVTWTREVNYKFRLSTLREALIAHYTSADANAGACGGVYPEVYRNAVMQALTQDGGLEDLSVSRPRTRIEWGIPVPGDPSQTVYVWFDALLVYLSGVGYPAAGAGTAWPPDVQVIGKDILRFHAIYLPAIIHAMGLAMPTTLLTHAHWTAGQKKMSKSVGNVADPLAAMDDYGVDAVRFFLARIGGRHREDVDWSDKELRKHADEIRNLLGNYFLRMTSKVIQRRAAAATTASMSYRDLLSQRFSWSRSDSGSWDDSSKLSTNDALLASLDALGDRVSQCMRHFELADALHAIMMILRHANGLVTLFEPWSKTCTSDDTLSCYLAALETLRITGILLQPFVPHASERLLDALHVPVNERHIAYARVGKSEMGDGQMWNVAGIKLFNMPARRESDV